MSREQHVITTDFYCLININRLNQSERPKIKCQWNIHHQASAWIMIIESWFIMRHLGAHQPTLSWTPHRPLELVCADSQDESLVTVFTPSLSAVSPCTVCREGSRWRPGQPWQWISWWWLWLPSAKLKKGNNTIMSSVISQRYSQMTDFICPIHKGSAAAPLIKLG